jgi:hypothetical protein
MLTVKIKTDIITFDYWLIVIGYTLDSVMRHVLGGDWDRPAHILRMGTNVYAGLFIFYIVVSLLGYEPDKGRK